MADDHEWPELDADLAHGRRRRRWAFVGLFVSILLASYLVLAWAMTWDGERESSTELVLAACSAIMSVAGALALAVRSERRGAKIDEACIDVARSLSTGPKLYAELLIAVGDEKALNRALAKLSEANRVKVTDGVSWAWRSE